MHGLEGVIGSRRGIEERAKAFNSLLADPSLDGFIATGGGKSTNAILALVDYELVGRRGRPIIGFSDVCVLLNAVTARTGLITFYGPNVLSKLDQSHHFGLEELTSLNKPARRGGPDAVTIIPGQAEGRLIGGNLSAFSVAIADTEFEPSYGPSILLWESGSRDWRSIARYLASLQTRGLPTRLSGMIVGKIGEDPALTSEENNLLRELLQPFEVPTLYLPMFGHGLAENPIWPIGGCAQLDASAGWIRFGAPFVSGSNAT